MALDTFTKVFSPAEDVRVIYRREGPSLTGAVETADVPLHKRAMFIVRNGDPKGPVSHVLLQLCFASDRMSDERPSSIMLGVLPPRSDGKGSNVGFIPYDSRNALWAKDLGKWLGRGNKDHNMEVKESGNPPLGDKNIELLRESVEKLSLDDQCEQQCYKVLGILRKALQNGHIQFDAAALENVFAPAHTSPGRRGPG